jgi:predicted TIM-barrel fold metal-dependent hydrolase
MTTTTDDQTSAAIALPHGIISADSHVIEEEHFWQKRLPQSLRDIAPDYPAPGGDTQRHPGEFEPSARLSEMAMDGVSAEVLYPTVGLRLFGLENAALQEACFRVYNDWLAAFCATSPDRLVGIACIAVYDCDHAVAELERCKKLGLKGALIWQAPHPDLPFTSDHYERFWAAAQDLAMPVNLHILTGFDYTKQGNASDLGLEGYRMSVNLKTMQAMNGLFDFIFYGVLDRFPRLKLVLVENEIGWLPFTLQQWDYYFRRFRGVNPPPIGEEPSAYFQRQVYATFFNDAVGGHNLSWWGVDNCMWSSDYPHPNSSWPNSRRIIERDLGGLPADAQAKLLRDNVTQLYGLGVPQRV